MGAAGSTTAAGFRIISIQPNSLAHKLQFEPYYDFIVSLNDQVITQTEPLGHQISEAAKNGDLEIGLYNAARRTARRVVVSRLEWGGRLTLGATVKYMPFSCVHEEGLRVLRVFENTPGAKCGLKGGTDWIIASSDGNSIVSLEDLAKLMRKSAHEKVPIGLIIYSSITGTVREVYCTPTINSRGEPYLGMELGHGAEDKIHFPTPTVSVSGSPDTSPTKLVPLPSTVIDPSADAQNESSGTSPQSEEPDQSFSLSCLNESVYPQEKKKLEQFLFSLRDQSSLYDQLLSRRNKTKEHFRSSQGWTPLIFDYTHIVNDELRTLPVSIPCYAVESG